MLPKGSYAKTRRGVVRHWLEPGAPDAAGPAGPTGRRAAARHAPARHGRTGAQPARGRASAGRREQQIDRATRDLDVALAEHALRRAELDLLGIEMLPGITAEKNRLILEEASAKVARAREQRLGPCQGQRRTHRIVSPLDGLVVLKAIWKNGAMGDVQEGEEVRAGIPILDVVDPRHPASRGRLLDVARTRSTASTSASRRRPTSRRRR